MSTPPYLLTLNNQNIDLVHHYIDEILSRIYTQSPAIKTLYLTLENGVENIKGVVVKDGTTYTKEDNRNFSSAIVSDATFINNSIYFINLYADIIQEEIKVIYNSNTYSIKKSLVIGNKRFYVLENL